jgi:hypothetical protein
VTGSALGVDGTVASLPWTAVSVEPLSVDSVSVAPVSVDAVSSLSLPQAAAMRTVPARARASRVRGSVGRDMGGTLHSDM